MDLIQTIQEVFDQAVFPGPPPLSRGKQHVLRMPEALNIAKAESTGTALDQGISAECNVENCELSLVISSHPCLSLGPHCLALHLTALVLPTHSSYTWYWDSTKSAGSFLWLWDMERFFYYLFQLSTDGWHVRRFAVHDLL